MAMIFYSTQKKEEWIRAHTSKSEIYQKKKNILRHIHKNTIRISRQFYILWSSQKGGIAIALSQKL